MNALVIGYGSIGSRHVKVLKSLGVDVDVVSRRKVDYEQSWPSVSSAFKDNSFDYIVIASRTNEHHSDLLELFSLGYNNNILIEKPLFDKPYNIALDNPNNIYVGYNLRFHPFIRLIKKLVLKKKIWNINVICGSYLPDWRKGRKYQKSYSAQKKSGGVLLDLSHELDYLKWIFGNFKPVYFNYRKVSNLKINSYDNLSLIADGKNKVNIQLYLNYFFKKPMRQILIDGKDLSINADLISNTMYVYKKNNFKKYLLNNFDVNIMYKNEHKEIINNKIKDICIYKEGIETMQIIDNISNKSI